VLLAACTETAPKNHAGSARPGPSAESPEGVPGRAPVVWISGRLRSAGRKTVTVVEPAGARVIMRRLAQGATRFLGRSGSSWTTLEEGSVSALRSGTPVCAETLRDRGVYLAIRVFAGATCGPRT
jgi:hypothetical protein